MQCAIIIEILKGRVFGRKPDANVGNEYCAYVLKNTIQRANIK